MVLVLIPWASWWVMMEDLIKLELPPGARWIAVKGCEASSCSNSALLAAAQSGSCTY